MTDHDTGTAGEFERRLSDALDATTASMPASASPTFSWQSDAPTARGRTRRRIPRPAAYAGAGLVAAAVAAAVVATTLPAGTHRAPQRQAGSSAFPTSDTRSATRTASPASAPTLLLDAARVRLDHGDPALQDGQFRYVRITGPAPDLITYDKSNQPHTVKPPAGSYTLDEYWIPKDQTDVWERRQSTVGDPEGGPADVWKGRCDDLYADTQDGPKGPACTRPGSFDDPTPAFVASLPRDPDALYAQLRSYSEKHLNPQKIDDVNYEMFTQIDSLLDGGVITGDLTSTLYAVLSRIPGITVVDGATNYAGVAGTGFRISTVLGHTLEDTSMIIVDPTDGAYLGDRDDSDGRHYASAVTTGVAERIGEPGN